MIFVINKRIVLPKNHRNYLLRLKKEPNYTLIKDIRNLFKQKN